MKGKESVAKAKKAPSAVWNVRVPAYLIDRIKALSKGHPSEWIQEMVRLSEALHDGTVQRSYEQGLKEGRFQGRVYERILRWLEQGAGMTPEFRAWCRAHAAVWSDVRLMCLTGEHAAAFRAWEQQADLDTAPPLLQTTPPHP